MATKKKKTVAKKKKPTLNQQLYQKELRRLKQFIRRTEKRGFHYAEDIIPEKPKRITKKSIERLQKLTAQELYKKATYKDSVTGSELTGVEGRQLERKRAASKGAKTKRTKRRPPFTPSIDDLPRATYEIIENVREEIRKWAPLSSWSSLTEGFKRRDKNILERMFEGAIRQEGENVIAARLEAHAPEVNTLVQEILYGSDGKDGKKINNDFARFAEILLGRGLTQDESMDLADEQEYIEDFEEDLGEQ